LLCVIATVSVNHVLMQSDVFHCVWEELVRLAKHVTSTTAELWRAVWWFAGFQFSIHIDRIIDSRRDASWHWCVHDTIYRSIV